MSVIFKKPPIISKYQCPVLFNECKKGVVFTKPSIKVNKAESNIIDCSCGTLDKRVAIKE